jgi:predicted PurR-regulated permease PerM
MQLSRLVRRYLVGAVILVVIYYLAQGIVRLSNLWMLMFGAVIVAVILRSIADPLVERLRWKDPLAVLAAVVASLLLVAGVGFLFGQQIAIQLDQLVQTLPSAWNTLRTRIDDSPAASTAVHWLGSAGPEAGRLLSRAPRFVLGAMSTLTTMILVIVAGVFLAIRPGNARDGLLSLLAPELRSKGREALDACGRALKGWLRAQLLSMIIVGSLVAAGLWLIGSPAPLALGLVAALAQFVPVVGPIAAAVPALVLAATSGPQSLVVTLALYLGVSQLEANLITPMVQKNVASLPIVLGIFAVVGFGTLFGPLGVVFATPLALVLYTLVGILYRRDVLGDEDVPIPGGTPRCRR